MNHDIVGDTRSILSTLGVDTALIEGGTLTARSPLTGDVIGNVRETTPDEARRQISEASSAFLAWRTVPALVVASSSGCLATRCGRTRTRLVASSRSKLARSSPKGSAKFRR